MNDPDPQATMHRALADGHRIRILDELRRDPDGLGARELGRRLDLHPNTIRWHIAILADAGLIASKTEPRSTRGRPRIVYTLGKSADAANPESYRFLATIMTGALSGSDDGPARAAEAGRAWGRFLVRRPPPHLRLTEDQATDQVVGLLTEQGFRPEAAPGEIRMHGCPFRDLAETGPEIVCAIHRGLISGAYAELGADLEVERLDAFVEPDLCVARLRRRPAAPAVER